MRFMKIVTILMMGLFVFNAGAGPSDRRERRQERRENRQERREERRETRQDRREDRRENRQERRQDRRENINNAGGAQAPVAPPASTEPAAPAQ